MQFLLHLVLQVHLDNILLPWNFMFNPLFLSLMHIILRNTLSQTIISLEM